MIGIPATPPPCPFDDERGADMDSGALHQYGLLHLDKDFGRLTNMGNVSFGPAILSEYVQPLHSNIDYGGPISLLEEQIGPLSYYDILLMG